MIIQSSNLTSSAGRYYSSHQEASTSTSEWDNNVGILNFSFAHTLERHTEASGDLADMMGKDSDLFEKEESSPMDQYQALQRPNSISSISAQLTELAKMRQRILDYLLNILAKKNYRKADEYDTYDLSGLTSSGEAQSGKGANQTTCYFYQEQEMTTFQTTGTVTTADGKTIDINVSLSMTRSFMEYSETSVDYGQPYLCDPLVLNFGGSATSVTDQKFLFDIDNDGTLDSISRLGEGSGFLAYDENEDGVINNGSELFGTQSGNGFADLARFDKDSNGWIDEADDIFQKLKIWVLNEDGTSKLLSLKEAGVGAIYLGSKDTQFSLTNASNEVNAMVRRTGLFLYENGTAGNLQQVDFAVSETA